MRFFRRAAFLLLLLAPLSVALPVDAPRAVFPDLRFAFGAPKQGTMIEHEFVVRNEGSAPLRILQVQLTAPLMLGRTPAQIEPGTEGRFRVRLDTSKLSGAFQGEIRIALNDPAMPEASLLVQGRIVPPIELLPRPVFFVAGQRGEHRQATIEIVNHEAEPLRLESIEHPRERFATKLDTVEEGRRYRLTLILKRDGPGGKKTESILVKTSSGTTPLLTIPAHTYLRERVYTFPDAVDLGALRLADIKAQPDLLQRTAQTVMIYQAGGTDFQVKPRTVLQELDLKWEGGPTGDRYQVTVALNRDQIHAGPIKGSIIIETNDPEFPSITVPVTGAILEP